MPASYPTSIKSFTTKTDLIDDVMAVDVNGIQDEVVAVETDLVSMRTGWIPDAATWTRASNTTFTISGDVTARFPKGTKIKVTDTTTKYFYVVSAVYGAPNTTVTITGGSTYVLVANPTARWYSYAVTPQNFPVSFSFTVNWTNLAVTGSPTSVGSFQMIGSRVFFSVLISPNGGTHSSTAPNTYFDLPISGGIAGPSSAFQINNPVGAGIASIWTGSSRCCTPTWAPSGGYWIIAGDYFIL